jgi:hypothetical protein
VDIRRFGPCFTAFALIILAPQAVRADNAPVAVNDTARTYNRAPVIVPVLQNDTGLADQPVKLSVIAAPGHGTVAVNGNETITYTPTDDFSGTDTLAYRIEDVDGDLGIASAAVDVVCTVDCARDALSLTLSWDPSPGDVTGYLVYFSDSQTGTPTLMTDTRAREVTYSGEQLMVQTGDSVCFMVRAYNRAAMSDLSQAVCDVL